LLLLLLVGILGHVVVVGGIVLLRHIWHHPGEIGRVLFARGEVAAAVGDGGFAFAFAGRGGGCCACSCCCGTAEGGV
jgi:hypothetical protein